MSWRNVVEGIDDRERRKWVGERAEEALFMDKERRSVHKGTFSGVSAQAADAMNLIFKEAKRAGEVDKTGTANASVRTMRKVFAKIDALEKR